MLDFLGLEPLLNFQMRLGEGTGAALGLTLLEAAVRVYREMATFGEAGVADQDGVRPPPCPLALTFLTKLPWPWRGPADETALARSMFWFPWVGALLGLIFWGAWLGLQKMPAPAAAGLLLMLTVWVTGGLHLDGLADTTDGLGGGHNPADALRIMKDSPGGRLRGHQPHPGPRPEIFPVPLFTHKSRRRGQSLLLYPVISRWAMVFLAYLSPYARAEGGLGQAMTLGVSPRVLASASLSAGALAVLIWAPRAWCSLPPPPPWSGWAASTFSAAWEASPATSWAPPTKWWKSWSWPGP